MKITASQTVLYTSVMIPAEAAVVSFRPVTQIETGGKRYQVMGWRDVMTAECWDIDEGVFVMLEFEDGVL